LATLSRTASAMPEIVDSKSGITTSERIGAFLKRNQNWIAGAMCCLALLRILIFAAAFPLFNNVDEQDHYEMVYRYAHGFVPQKTLPQTDPEMARVFTLYGSPEYFASGELLRSLHLDLPIAQLPEQMKEVQYQRVLNSWMKQSTFEAQSPPLYYMVAAAWYRLGALLGWHEWALAYWVRFLNAFLYAAFVWVSFLFVKQIYPDNGFLCVAVPMFLAVFPQDVFFGMNRDVLPPLLVASVLLLLFRAMRQGSRWKFELIAGSFLAGFSFLTDVSNFVLFGVLGVVLCLLGARAVKKRSPPRELAGILTAAVAALLPPLLWMARNRVVMGDLTGSKAKTAYLGWTIKPWHEMLQHPIFSVHGVSLFIGDLIRLYWRGEFIWHGSPLRWPVADAFYLFSSYLMVLGFALYLWRDERGKVGSERFGNYVSLYLVVASVLFLAALSLPFDFHQCYYPSRAYPYFVSGRIISGTILPFVAIYLIGLEYLWRPARKYLHPIFPVLAICVFILAVETSIRATVFHSRFNLFTLR
jgi:Predicted membrane protein (DUF2142)